MCGDCTKAKDGKSIKQLGFELTIVIQYYLYSLNFRADRLRHEAASVKTTAGGAIRLMGSYRTP